MQIKKLFGSLKYCNVLGESRCRGSSWWRSRRQLWEHQRGWRRWTGCHSGKAMIVDDDISYEAICTSWHIITISSHAICYCMHAKYWIGFKTLLLLLLLWELRWRSSRRKWISKGEQGLELQLLQGILYYRSSPQLCLVFQVSSTNFLSNVKNVILDISVRKLRTILLVKWKWNYGLFFFIF